jgi:small subunit ribosomal protein S1
LLILFVGKFFKERCFDQIMGERQISTNVKEKSKLNQKWMEEFSSFVEEGVAEAAAPESGSFASLFEASQKEKEMEEGSVVDGRIVHISPDYVTIDLGLKCEGQIPLYEFKDATGKPIVETGVTIQVFIEKIDIEGGSIICSKDKAQILAAWDEISAACESDQIVEGTVIAKVKGGLTVDIGVKAFLPGSQLDNKPVKRLDDYIGKKLKTKIIKFNKRRGNIVLSRKAVLQQERDLQREETLKSIEEGMVVTGTVKNITEYGAFIDLGGIDGLLHITDMSWGRVKHPSELFAVGDDIKVKVLKYDREKERVSLGLKQVSPDPWDEAELKYPVGKQVKGKVVSLKDYGAFIELEDGVEGLIHVSEMSWTERVKHPNKVLKADEEVECKVLEVDTASKRISLGIKQLQANPWDELEMKYPVGTIIEEASVKSITDFGVFVDVGMGIDGLIHVSDVSWTKKFNHPSELYKKADKVRAVVLGIDKQTEKFSLGVKQLERDPWDNIKARYRQGQSVEGNVTKLTDFGAFVELEEGVEGLIYVSEISEQRIEKPSDVLKVGEPVNAEILSVEPKERRIALSIKQLNRNEERSNYESYMGGEKKASMGDLLGDKLKGILNKSDESKDD